MQWVRDTFRSVFGKRKRQDAEEQITESEISSYPGSKTLQKRVQRGPTKLALSQDEFEAKMNKRFKTGETENATSGSILQMEMGGFEEFPKLRNGALSSSASKVEERKLNKRSKKKAKQKKKFMDTMLAESRSFEPGMEWIHSSSMIGTARRTTGFTTVRPSPPKKPRATIFEIHRKASSELVAGEQSASNARKRVERDILERNRAACFDTDWRPFRVLNVGQYRCLVQQRLLSAKSKSTFELDYSKLSDTSTWIQTKAPSRRVSVISLGNSSVGDGEDLKTRTSICDWEELKNRTNSSVEENDVEMNGLLFEEEEKDEGEEDYDDDYDVDDDEYDDVEEPLVGPEGEVFTDKDLAEIEAAWDEAGDGDDILGKNSTTNVYRSQLLCLQDGEWLNDEVLNFMFDRLNENQIALRKNPANSNAPRIWIWNTHFYVKLMNHQQGSEVGEKVYTFKNVQRWTKRKKLNILEMDRIVVPIHEGIHWACAVIDMKNKSFHYYDSLHIQNRACLDALARWVHDEVMDKSNVDLPTLTWDFVFHQDIPQQSNQFDCGVFAYMFCKTVGHGLPIHFGMPHMPYLRRRMLLDILESGRTNQK